jgi:hypothetical protein
MYELVTTEILVGVIIDEDMLGNVPQLKYVDQNIIDKMKFPEIVSDNYLEMKIDAKMYFPVVELKVWARGLEQASLLNLFDIPQFGRSEEINACVNMLLKYVHDGYFWLDRLISIDKYLII